MAPISKIELGKVLELYKKGKITLGRAAELAGLSLWEILEVVRKRRIPMPYTIEDVEKYLEQSKKFAKQL